MEILYSSDAIHGAIKNVLADPVKGGTRVVLVPYIGAAAGSYLPSPEGMQIVCCLQPQATSAKALQELRDRKAIIQQSPRLHMKVYWSSSKGCVIASSNLSQNSLGKGGLIEAGVYFPPGIVDVKRFLKTAAPTPVSASDLRNLQIASDILESKIGHRGPRHAASTYEEWFDSESRVGFKLGIWWQDGPLAKTSRKHAKEVFNSSNISDHLTVNKAGAKPNDWLLCFRAPQVTEVEWLRVDSVVPVSKGDPAYESKCPLQAIQVFPSVRYPTPPFNIKAPGFLKALRSTVKDLGAEELDSDSMKPSKKFIAMLRARV